MRHWLLLLIIIIDYYGPAKLLGFHMLIFSALDNVTLGQNSNAVCPISAKAYNSTLAIV